LQKKKKNQKEEAIVNTKGREKTKNGKELGQQNALNKG